jgi:hypothetical protein
MGGIVYWIHRIIYLRSYANSALFWVNIDEIDLTTSGENFSYRILTKFAKRFVGYGEGSMYSLMSTRGYYDSVRLNIGITPGVFVKVSHVEF